MLKQKRRPAAWHSFTVYARIPSLLLSLLAAAVAGIAAAGEYETDSPQLQASKLLNEDLLKGPNHTIQETVVNRGYMNQYRIDTALGEFTVSGDAQVPVAVHEIDAVVKLRQMSKTGLVAKSASEAVQKPVETVKQVTEDPVETIKGIPAGVGRLFARAKDVAKDVAAKGGASAGGDSDAGAEVGSDLARKYLGVSSAQRKLAEELQVDPYTTNEVLQAELAGMAKYAAAGSLGTKLLMPSIPGMGMISSVNDLVWNLSARDLRLRNRESLKAMGVDETLVERLFANPGYTPTDRTRAVVGLEVLDGTAGREIFIARAANAETRAEALAYTRLAMMLAAYHRSRAPLVRLVDSERRLPLALTNSGAAVLAVPLDYVNWQKSTEGAAEAFMRAASREGKVVEIWIEGRVSERARRELRDRGWRIFDEALRRLDKPAG